MLTDSSEVRNIKYMLMEAENNLSKLNYDVNADYHAMVADDTAFGFYVETLAEGLDPWPDIKEEFIELSKGPLKKAILENSMFGFYPQAKLALPIFRKFWPKLVARQAVTVLPMDASEVVRIFLRATATVWGGTTYDLPSTSAVSSGPGIGTDSTYTISVGTTDILNSFGLTSDQASIEHDLRITGWSGLDSGGAAKSGTVYITPDDEGNFFSSIAVDSSATDYVTGHIDYDAGKIYFHSANSAAAAGKVTGLNLVGHVSLEQNVINPRVKLTQEKVWLKAIEKKISADWTAEFEQDMKAYYDLDAQAEFVNVFGNQVATEIDYDIISDLINWTTSLHSDAVESFNYSPTPSDQFYYGQKQWLENIIPVINTISSKIYNDTNIGMANVIVGNPQDVAIFESLDQYRAAGNPVDGASLGKIVPTTGTLAGKWTVLSSPVVPLGKLLVLLKPEEVKRAVYVYGVYRPLVISPYPLGPTPSITLFSRYAKQLIRYEGLGLVEISRT